MRSARLPGIACLALLTIGHGVAPADPGERFDTPAAAVGQAYLEEEPLAATVLERLQALLPQATDPEVALRGAALLYRYEREPGRTKLLRALRLCMAIHGGRCMAVCGRHQGIGEQMRED